MALNCTTVEEVLKIIKDKNIRMVDLRFTDLPGTWQHFSVPPSAVDADAMSEGIGFDDFLIAVGHTELATSMLADLDAAIAKANALPDSFLTGLSSNYAAIVDTHTAIRQFTNDLKSQFLTVLALDIPDDVASDND